jgi:hypothetical protein
VHGLARACGAARHVGRSRPWRSDVVGAVTGRRRRRCLGSDDRVARSLPTMRAASRRRRSSRRSVRNSGSCARAMAGGPRCSPRTFGYRNVAQPTGRASRPPGDPEALRVAPSPARCRRLRVS